MSWSVVSYSLRHRKCTLLRVDIEASSHKPCRVNHEPSARYRGDTHVVEMAQDIAKVLCRSKVRLLESACAGEWPSSLLESEQQSNGTALDERGTSARRRRVPRHRVQADKARPGSALAAEVSSFAVDEFWAFMTAQN